LDSYTVESTGERTEGTFALPADANRDSLSLEWVIAPKDGSSSTLSSFNNLMMQRHLAMAKTGGLTGLTAITAQATGYSNVNTENEIDLQIAENPEQTE